MAKRRSGSTNYRNRKTTKSKGPIESLFSMAKDAYTNSPISKLFGKDSEFKVGGDSKGAKFTPAATAQRKKNMKIAGQKMLKSPKFQKAVSDAAESAMDIGGMAKITKITNLAGKSVKVKQGEPFRKVKARTDKAKLKIATENKEARAPAIAESKAYRESFGSHRVVEPTRKDYLFPAKTYEDHKYARPTKDMPNPIASRVDNEMSIMSGTDKNAINRIKKGKENRRFLDEGYKIEYVGPGQRDMGGGKKQNWVSGTDIDVAMNKASQTGDKKDIKRVLDISKKASEQTSDRYKDINPNMVDHHTEVVKKTIGNAQGRGKDVSRVFIAKEPPELKAFGQGKEQDIAGLKSDLGKATQHGFMESFTPEELAHPTTQKFKKVTRDYGKKQAQNEKLSTGELDDGSRAWPEKAKVSDITGEKGKAFRASEKLKIEKKEAKKRKTAETIARKKAEQGNLDAELEAGELIQFRKELATKIKAEPNKKKRKKILKIATGRTPGIRQTKKNSEEIPF
tara:strand:+ start:186 stop:1715 length:1530 start_codon:yes stop_codon:yes gene_type:complete